MGRRLGQHFLTRGSILESIAEAACPHRCETVIEIGPGRGSLTAHLLNKAERVVAIEIDPVLAQYLTAHFRETTSLQVVQADVLKADLSQWGPATVAGNLPYYITSPIVEKVLGLGPLLQRAIFLVQKEVAERLTAAPGSRDYGYLSVATQFYADARLLFAVPRDAFRPPPKVESAIVLLEPKASLPVEDPSRFLEFVGRCFRHKRKTLRNNLSEFYPRELLDKAPGPGRRAEQLSIPDFLELWQKLRPA
ncbi:MAG: 16S rRNA (adenine(1518)-N(6)/adenine(1519)-N(6))-dimethyltransferase RsmA [Acidobacteriota bacterium]|nr:16S rRNA (adenine(1518)-N(6)/adenine(1519)-N(6))-dimethyltransferase RsmA [Acidobacteriota bacterium]